MSQPANRRTGTVPIPIVLLIAIFVLPVFRAGAALAAATGPQILVEETLLSNPNLKALALQITALQHKAQVVQKWSDPVFAVEYSNFPTDSWSMGDSPMTGVQFKLQQNFPLFGKNERRRAVVQAETRAFEWTLTEKRNQLTGLVKKTFWNLALVRQLRSITLQHIELVSQFIEVLRARYQVGKVGQHDLMRLQVLKDRLEDDLGEFARRERSLSATLNAARHQSPGEFIPTPKKITSLTPTRNLAELIELARTRRPALQGLELQSEARELAATAADYERWPDVTLWAGYRIRKRAGMDNGGDQMSLGLAVPLPFDYSGKSVSLAAQHRAEAAAVQERKSALLDEIKAALETALAAWERSSKQAVTYSGKLIPATRQTLDSTMVAYQSDRADFASLYQVELELLNFDRVLLKAQSQTRIQKAVIETLTGKNLVKNEMKKERHAEP